MIKNIFIKTRKIFYPKCPRCGDKKFVLKLNNNRYSWNWECKNHGEKYTVKFKNNKGGKNENRKNY